VHGATTESDNTWKQAVTLTSDTGDVPNDRPVSMQPEFPKTQNPG